MVAHHGEEGSEVVRVEIFVVNFFVEHEDEIFWVDVHLGGCETVLKVTKLFLT